MDAEQFRGWASRFQSASSGWSGFTDLAGRLETAAGPGHFLESAAAEKSPDVVKLALILEAPLPELAGAAARRDSPAKAELARSLLAELADAGSPRDTEAAERALGLLKRWRLQGSLMISLDYDRSGRAPGKLSLYGYAPAPEAPACVLAGFGLEGTVVDVHELGFWGLDLPPGGGWTLKLYDRRPWPDADAPGELAAAAHRLAPLARPRDWTRLTRLAPDGTRGPTTVSDKAYLGYREGIALEDLAEARPWTGCGPFLGRLAREAAGMRAFFLGKGPEGWEAYFDRRRRSPEPEEVRSASGRAE